MDMQAVTGPLNEGIASICNISKSLMEADVDPNTDVLQFIKASLNIDHSSPDIRAHIEHAEHSLRKSETMINQKLKYLDEQMEHLIQEKGKVEQQHKEKCMGIEKLHVEKTCMEDSLKYSKVALESAEKKVELTKDELKREKDRIGTGALVTGAGVAVLVIPIAGWIAGPIMMYEGVCIIEKAVKAVRDAEDELQQINSQVKKNSRKVFDHQSRIRNIQKDINVSKDVLNKIQREMKEVKKQLEVTGEFQEKVRRTTHLLTVLRGKVSVLEKQTRRFILWRPVLNMIENVMKAAGFLADNRLVCGEDVPGLISTLRENMEGLLALCHSHNNPSLERYY